MPLCKATQSMSRFSHIYPFLSPLSCVSFSVCLCTPSCLFIPTSSEICACRLWTASVSTELSVCLFVYLRPCFCIDKTFIAKEVYRCGVSKLIHGKAGQWDHTGCWQNRLQTLSHVYSHPFRCVMEPTTETVTCNSTWRQTLENASPACYAANSTVKLSKKRLIYFIFKINK